MVWAITIFVLAAMYGSVFGDLESFVKDNEMLRAIFTANSEYSYAEQFIALLMTIMSMIAAIPVLTFAGRVSAEERHGYAEHLLGRAVSRYEQMAAYLILALIVSVALQILLALGFWSVGSVVMSEIPSLGTFLQSALSYLPAIWVLMGVSVLLVAFVPRYTALTYVYLGYTFVSVYLGTIADFPEWTRKLTPFGYVPQYPIEKMETAPLIILTGIAAILVASGCWRYGHRDVANQ
jgi:Putative exporter of polyketide antibiotics